jgi:hypothetical protein
MEFETTMAKRAGGVSSGDHTHVTVPTRFLESDGIRATRARDPAVRPPRPNADCLALLTSSRDLSRSNRVVGSFENISSEARRSRTNYEQREDCLYGGEGETVFSDVKVTDKRCR